MKGRTEEKETAYKNGAKNTVRKRWRAGGAGDGTSTWIANRCGGGGGGGWRRVEGEGEAPPLGNDLVMIDLSGDE